jgi:hypothetical protein
MEVSYEIDLNRRYRDSLITERLGPRRPMWVGRFQSLALGLAQLKQGRLGPDLPITLCRNARRDPINSTVPRRPEA